MTHVVVIALNPWPWQERIKFLYVLLPRDCKPKLRDLRERFNPRIGRKGLIHTAAAAIGAWMTLAGVSGSRANHFTASAGFTSSR